MGGDVAIRSATNSDIPALTCMAEVMHAESPRLSRIPFSAAKVSRLFSSLIALPDGLVLVVEVGGVIVGGVAAVVSEHWFSDEKVATEFGIFLMQEHRGGLAAARLVRSYIDWARTHGVGPGWVKIGISTGVHQEKTAELYEALGAKLSSLVFEV